jgi:hypothetical protein
MARLLLWFRPPTPTARRRRRTALGGATGRFGGILSNIVMGYINLMLMAEDMTIGSSTTWSTRAVRCVADDHLSLSLIWTDCTRALLVGYHSFPPGRP